MPRKKTWKVSIFTDPSKTKWYGHMPIGSMSSRSATGEGLTQFEPFEFIDRLTYENTIGGSHGISQVSFIGSKGERYYMFISTFAETVSTRGMEPGGFVEGKWTFEKNGPSVGIKPIN